MDYSKEPFLVNAMREMASFVMNAIEYIRSDEVEAMIELLLKVRGEGRRILVMGAGRSNLVGKAFAMRLLHLGYKVHVLGDTIVPALRPGDAVIAVSGSGRTKLIVDAAEVAKSVGAKIVALTSFRDSPLAKIADIIVEIPGRSEVSSEKDYFSRQILGIYEPLAPLGTLFEVTATVFLDALIVELMHRIKELGKP